MLLIVVRVADLRLYTELLNSAWSCEIFDMSEKQYLHVEVQGIYMQARYGVEAIKSMGRLLLSLT